MDPGTVNQLLSQASSVTTPEAYLLWKVKGSEAFRSADGGANNDGDDTGFYSECDAVLGFLTCRNDTGWQNSKRRCRRRPAKNTTKHAVSPAPHHPFTCVDDVG